MDILTVIVPIHEHGLSFYLFVFSLIPFILFVIDSSFIQLWSEKILDMVSVLNFLSSFYGSTYDLSWGMFYVCLRRECILLLLYEMFSICLLYSAGLQCYSDSGSY